MGLFQEKTRHIPRDRGDKMKRIIIEVDDDIFEEINISITEFVNEMHSEDVASGKVEFKDV